MKSAVYEVTGCIGSQKFRERSEYDTMREAKAEAKRLNNHRAGMQGKSLREFMDDLNDEGKFFAGKAGNNGAPLQR
ncbi:MAG: hypothetical protein KGR46_07370 [Verrucomicrobia bacterium]|nr:hypothetical protein [Verrucomicrobiota bacterium]